MPDLNYVAVVLCAVLGMALGAYWYGPLLGKMWLHTIGATEMDLAARAAMQRRAMPLYAAQTVLTLFQMGALAYFLRGWQDALWIWAAFVMPTVAAGAMWNNDSARVSWTRFGIQAGYQLVLFAIAGVILDFWR